MTINSKYNIFIDSNFLSKKNKILSIFNELHDFSYESFHFFFLAEEKTDEFKHELLKYRDEMISCYKDDDEKIKRKIDDLILHVLETNISFSWGYLDYEFVFIFLEENLLEQSSALRGLVIHEALHGIERQRGLEDDLKRSLNLTLQTFTDMAKLLPKYDKKELTTMLRSIGELTVYVLKDLYVNREAIERGFALEILDQYKYLFQIENDSSTEKLPKLELYLEDFKKDEVIDLKEFEKAFITLIGFTTAWLPFIRLSSGYETKQALEIKDFINETYNKVCLISERFRHLENVYLTEFSFTKSFHQRWFSEVFSIIIDILSQGEFVIWQFSHLVIKLENLIEDRIKATNGKGDDETELYTLKDLILIPTLKAAYLFSSNSTLTSITEEIKSKLNGYLSKEEMAEWIQDHQEYSQEHLLCFVLSELVNLLRKKFLLSIQKLRVYTGLVLDVLELITDLKQKPKFFDKYKAYKQKIIQFITTRDSRFISLKILFPLEFELKKDLNELAELEGNIPFTPEQATEFLMLLRFFALPKLNWLLEIGPRFAQIIKLNIKDKKDIDVEVIALTSVMLIQDFKGDNINPDLLVPLYRATLMTLGLPMNKIKSIVQLFGNLLKNNQEENDSESKTS